jgi:hypothetical protein
MFQRNLISSMLPPKDRTSQQIIDPPSTATYCINSLKELLNRVKCCRSQCQALDMRVLMIMDDTPPAIIPFRVIRSCSTPPDQSGSALVSFHICITNQVALRCLTLSCLALPCAASSCLTLPHSASYCRTLPHAASRCLTLPRAASRCLALPHAASRCLALPHAASRCLTLPRAASRCLALPHAASR